MVKDIEHRQLTSTIELTRYRDGFWLYDATRRMSLATGAETPEAAFVEAIEYYQKKLAEAEAKIPKWIPIRRGITYPPNDTGILILTKHDEVLTAYVTKEGITPDDWFHGPITHWMPKPEVPESRKGEVKE